MKKTNANRKTTNTFETVEPGTRAEEFIARAAELCDEMLPKVSMIPPKILGQGETLNVTAYCRVSTDLEEQQYSYHQQQEYYSNYISRHEGWKFIGIYADEGLSGTSMKKRKEFNRMMQDALDGKIDYILVKSISRFARNTVDALNCTRTLKALNPPVGVYFEKEHIDTLDSRGELILTIMCALAQDESRSISDNVKWSLQKKFQNGEDVTNLNSMLGYDWGENKEWVINEEQAEIVRYIYRRYLDGLGTDAIAKELMEKGYKTGRGNSVWRGGAVRKILVNEKYVGDAHLQKTMVRDFFSHVSVTNDGAIPSYYVRDHHMPIIDRCTWNSVQAEMKRRSEQSVSQGKRRTKYSSKWCFSSRFRCGNCGGVLIRRTFRVTVKDRVNNISAKKSGCYFVYPVWRCAAVEHPKENQCREPSYMELSIQQSFMEYLYILRSQVLNSVYEEEDTADQEEESFSVYAKDYGVYKNCVLVRAFLRAYEQEQNRQNRSSGTLERLQNLEMNIRKLENQLNETKAMIFNLQQKISEDEPEEIEESPEKESLQIYSSMATNLVTQLAKKKEEYDALLKMQEDITGMKKTFDWFLKELTELPEKNPAGMPLHVYGLNVGITGFIPGQNEEEITQEMIERAPDIIPFQEEIFRKIIVQGTVMNDGRIAYKTCFGVNFVVRGNERRFPDFQGFRRAKEDGTVKFLIRAEDIVEGVIRVNEKKKAKK